MIGETIKQFGLQFIVPILSTVLPTIILGIIADARDKKEKRKLLAQNRKVYFNNDLYKIATNKVITCLFITFGIMTVDTIIGAIIGYSNLLKWVTTVIISCIIEHFYLKRGSYWGLDKYGKEKDYKFRVYLYVYAFNIFMISMFAISTYNPNVNVWIYFIVELILAFGSIWIFTFSKKISHCERIEIWTNKNGMLKVLPQNIEICKDNSILIKEQNKSVMIYSERQIVYKKIIFTQEYEQWMEREKIVKQMNIKNENGNKIAKEKSDIFWEWVIGIGAIPLIIMIVDVFLKKINIPYFWKVNTDGLVQTLFEQQMTITTIFIAVIALMVNNISDRFLHASTKFVFFKRYVYQPNYSSILLISLMLDISAFICYIFNSPYGCLASFILAFVDTCVIIVMTYNLISKKSKVYQRMWRVLGKRNKGKELYKELIKKLKPLAETKKVEIDNSYLAEELITLYKLYCMSDNDDKELIEQIKALYVEKCKEVGNARIEILLEKYQYIEDILKIRNWMGPIGSIDKR